mgnify:CR=1 FL=1
MAYAINIAIRTMKICLPTDSHLGRQQELRRQGVPKVQTGAICLTAARARRG